MHLLNLTAVDPGLHRDDKKKRVFLILTTLAPATSASLSDQAGDSAIRRITNSLTSLTSPFI